ncbi:hypothetical protein CIPAW_05G162300 [Carya illinoinensis]|uniref:Uncharacterized protein n=1 Tax=Carya illinoinensis TaxID=32201 RepID=A0A8T1QKP8_CARIL|nr:hypothetical protein CIPAW_05G162300 [Carya illinoinensis]
MHKCINNEKLVIYLKTKNACIVIIDLLVFKDFSYCLAFSCVSEHQITSRLDKKQRQVSVELAAVDHEEVVSVEPRNTFTSLPKPKDKTERQAMRDKLCGGAIRNIQRFFCERSENGEEQKWKKIFSFQISVGESKR